MDPLHAWKDDFSREVEEVLASRSHSQERGEGTPVEGFGGRLADLIIPPAGAYAELRDALKNLALAQAEVQELHERLKAKDAQFEREREGRERMKDGAARLAFMLRDERAALVVAKAEAERAWQQVGVAGGERDAARLDAEHAAARAEDWEREATARLRGVREIQARLDLMTLDSDEKEAEAASMRARFDAAVRRSDASEAALAAALADAGLREALLSRLEFERVEAQREAEASASRTSRAEASERTALSRLAAIEAEVRSMSASSATFEREAQRLIEENSKAREDAAAAQIREHSAAQAFAAERARGQVETAALVERAEAQRAEGERSLDRARRLEAEIPVRLDAALREERALLKAERETADRELHLAREARREAAARAAETEILLDAARAAAMREAREQGQAAYAQGLSAAQMHAENAERALESSRRAEAVASEKARMAIASLGEYRDRMRDEIQRLAAAMKEGRDQGEAAVAAARRAEAQAQARLDGEVARREAVLEEARAALRAEFEDARAKLEDELDAERRTLRERWKEQTEALARLRKDLERGHPGT